MKRFEAPSLQEAYEKAAKYFGCSVTEIDTEIIQHPSAGLFGLFQKPAIIVATCKKEETNTNVTDSSSAVEKVVADEVVKHIVQDEPMVLNTLTQETLDDSAIYQVDEIVEDFFDKDETEKKSEGTSVLAPSQTHPSVKETFGDDSELARYIEEALSEMMRVSCFDIDTVEVDVDNNTAYVFIDGEDAALLIGKEGYRYNALSYMIFNWLHSRFGLYLKLEIAQFYTSQQEMIRHMLQPLIEDIRRVGSGRTRFLDGILVQIALEELRQAFPDKYVAIKKARDGRRFVVVNDFYASKE